jgi:2-amino-4-hydroxy-6-hydroxymethyldihydropteridine diphosphokinase
MKEEVYIGLGANLGDPYFQLTYALNKLRENPAINQLQVSRFYQTTPVSPVEQPLFLNGVCRFTTTLSLSDLWKFLMSIQENLGQGPKPKTAPRKIDLDILFFGLNPIIHEELQIPHPRLYERLFVLQPLSDLTDRVGNFNVNQALKTVSYRHQEQVRPYEINKS